MRGKSSHNLLKAIILTLSIFISLQTSAQKQKVSCTGDSITYGYGLSDSSTESYPSQLQVLLGTTNWIVYNYGDSGRTMLKAGGYSYRDSGLYTNALASNPDIVVLGLGTNDSKDWLWNSSSSGFKTDYTAMVKSFEILASKPDVWVFLIIPGEKADWGIYNSTINMVNTKIKEVALEKGLGIIDLNTAFSAWNPLWYQSDNIHPSKQGATLIANTVNDMLIMAKPTIFYANGVLTSPDGDDYQWYIDGAAVTSGDGGNQKEMPITKTGIYKVSIKLIAGNETRIVSKELNVSVLSKIDYKI